MADVRGFLGDAQSKFRNATATVQPGNRLAFEQAWQEFESRWNTLSEKQNLLTAKQREVFELFSMAHEAYAENAESMITALYHIEPTATVPTGSEVVP